MSEFNSLSSSINTMLILSFMLNILFSIIIATKLIPSSEIETSERLIDQVSKRDYFYWMLIVIFFTVINTTYQYKNSEDIISHWSFAGTLVSIILAVIAIIFTLYQAITGDLASRRINDAVDSLEELNGLINSDILKESTSNMQKASNLLEIRLEEISEHLKSMSEKVLEFVSDNEKVPSLTLSEIDSDIKLPESLLEQFIEKNYSNLNTPTQFTIYCYFYLFNYNKDMFNDSKVLRDIEKLINNTFLRYNRIRFKAIGETDEIEYERKIDLYTANFAGIHSATQALLFNLGILESFKTLEMSKQEEILKILDSKLSRLRLIREFKRSFAHFKADRDM